MKKSRAENSNGKYDELYAALVNQMAGGDSAGAFGSLAEIHAALPGMAREDRQRWRGVLKGIRLTQMQQKQVESYLRDRLDWLLATRDHVEDDVDAFSFFQAREEIQRYVDLFWEQFGIALDLPLRETDLAIWSRFHRRPLSGASARIFYALAVPGKGSAR